MTLGDLLELAQKEGATPNTRLTVKVNNKWIVPVTEIVAGYGSNTPVDLAPDTLQLEVNFKSIV